VKKKLVATGTRRIEVRNVLAMFKDFTFAEVLCGEALQRDLANGRNISSAAINW
jgi:hypothetical protein